MKNQHRFTLHYIDAFAGAAEFEIRTSESADQVDMPDIRAQRSRYIKGSPVRALDASGVAGRTFDHFYFIDLDRERVAHLNQLKLNYPGRNIHTACGDANDLIKRLLPSISRPTDRAVIFLDPYGAHLHWDTLRLLAAEKKFDVIINFPLHMCINRLTTANGPYSAEAQAQLNRFFGSNEWEDIVYQQSTDLFNQGRITKSDTAVDDLLDLYMDNLNGIFNQVSNPHLVRNSRNSPLYYLIWAGENKIGRKIGDHILRLGSKIVRRKK